MPTRASRDGRKRRPKQDTLDSFFGGAPSSPPRPEASPRTANRRVQRGRVSTAVTSANGSDDGSQSSDAGAIHFEPAPVTTDDDELRSSPRRPMKRRRLTRRRAESDDEDDRRSSTLTHEKTSVSATENNTTNKAAGKQKEVEPDDEGDEEEVQLRRRKLVKGRRPCSPDEEEEEDLRNEVDENRIIEPRLRSRDKKSAFQRNLERLKRRKRGQPLASVSSSEDEDEAEVVPFEDARPSRRNVDTESEGDEDDDAADDTFIVEDDNAVVPELPAEFSMNTYQDLLHHFKIICQLFVHVAVHPRDDRETVVHQYSKNQYFSVPLQIARRKLLGMRDSLVASSIWRADFKKSLETFPEFEVVHLDYAEPGCDACHLGSRMSTRLGRLSGLPYDRTTFEPLNERDSSVYDSDDDEEYVQHLKKEFNLGRFCAARTRVYHRFSHWEWSLFKELSREVDDLRTGAGARGFVRVAYARGARPPDDLSDADGIMDWLDQRGIINIEWQKVKEMMESARNLEMKAKRGEADDDD